ncbi:hypothetical protein C2G38_2303217 [Gigaspora rosea]|uniref:Uncharacterized protein n=1 Tax=Gigaspora rosea TaxID=44941 RepID=A0A397VDZ3_9GLOM|nr:hypothetical protein C2G38_2303217 [Gigaspora rosea]
MVIGQIQEKNPNNPHARISGVHVFCLNILDIEKERERKHRSSSFRPFNTLSESMKTNRSRAFSVQLDKAFKNEVPNFFNSVARPVLQEIQFCVQDKDYLAKYNKEKTSSFDAFVKVIDQGPISQDAYRKLAVLQPELPRDHNISDARKNINEEMNKQAPINILNAENISLTTTNEIPHINNQEIEEDILKYIGKAGYRRITNILLFIIPCLIKQNILNTDNPILHVHLSGDGRNVGRKIKHVMITCTVLDDIPNINKADSYNTVILYPGVKTMRCCNK